MKDRKAVPDFIRLITFCRTCMFVYAVWYKKLPQSKKRMLQYFYTSFNSPHITAGSKTHLAHKHHNLHTCLSNIIKRN